MIRIPAAIKGGRTGKVFEYIRIWGGFNVNAVDMIEQYVNVERPTYNIECKERLRRSISITDNHVFPRQNRISL